MVVALAVDRIHEEVERRLEDVRDLGRVGARLEARGDDADDGCHAVAGRGQVLVEVAEHAHLGRREADLLLRLAQRGVAGRGVGRVDPAAREGDLAGVALEVRRAVGEDHVQPTVALAQAAEHGGPALLVQLELGGLDVRVEVEIRALAKRRQPHRRLDVVDRQRHPG